jgi:predicted amidohydrolase YtcJ
VVRRRAVAGHLALALAVSSSALSVSCFRHRSAKADLILIKGVVHTLAPSIGNATALAVRQGRILAVGDDGAVLRLRGSGTPVVDLQGRTVIPGLIDAGVHLLGVGEALLNEATGESLYLDLSGTESEQDAVQRVRSRTRALAPGDWALGRGWDQERWTGRQLPDKRLLSDIVQNTPAFLVSSDAHAVWVNRRALDLAGINARTPDPPGGRILRMARTGEPSGILLGRAWELALRRLPQPTRDDRARAILQALQRFAAMGCTLVESQGSLNHLGLLDLAAGGDEEADLFRSLADAGRLPIRVSLMIPGPSDAAEALLRRGPEIGLAQERLDIRGIELMADGALGSRGAALLQPYTDDPSTSGILRMSEEEIASWTARGLRRGVQVAVHASGDAAARAASRAFASTLALSPGAEPRFRIDPLTLFDPADLGVLVRAGVIATIQPGRLAPGTDGPPEARRVGEERAARLEAYGTLLEAGLDLAGASGSFDRPLGPWIGLYAAITRQGPDGRPEGGWHPEQRLKRAEALRLFTLGAAYAAFREKDAGSLEPGKWADFVVLSQDILTVPEVDLLETEVLSTYVGGHEVYRKPAAAPGG